MKKIVICLLFLVAGACYGQVVNPAGSQQNIFTSAQTFSGGSNPYVTDTNSATTDNNLTFSVNSTGSPGPCWLMRSYTGSSGLWWPSEICGKSESGPSIEFLVGTGPAAKGSESYQRVSYVQKDLWTFSVPIAQATQTAIASAATIAPTATVFHVTGTTAITTITPPGACTTAGFACQITIIPDGLFTTGTSGNIALASTAVVSKALILTYDPGTSKWYPSY